ncbi:Methyltransferase-like protein 17 [Acropora cervicornis]|uniref:Methyltransferase-like protein 17 n=1 Tax=Acropora cervicornis TaxID=6130 RepID=A0AAD9UUZ8_ACRCE|nr:Methyltransferase-like protein 17 [Acropora cervicornis]
MNCKSLSFRSVICCKSSWVIFSRCLGDPLKVLNSRLTTIYAEPTQDENVDQPLVEKYAYGKTGYDKRNKQAEGLFYLNTVHLPDQLEKSLKQYLKKFPKKVIENDGRKLARHIKNRGRPTEQTWQKYREFRRQRNVRAETEVIPEDILKLELQERGSTLEEDTDKLLSEDGEGEFDEQSESGSQEYQQELEDFGKKTAENETIDNDKDDLSGEDNIQQKVKNVKKPKRNEYKVIRQQKINKSRPKWVFSFYFYRYNKRESAAYAASRIPSSYGATLRVFHEISRCEPDFKPETLLDFGSGTGMAVWAAHEKWGDSIREYQCVDVSQDMIDVAQNLLRGGEETKDSLRIPRVYFKRFLPVSNLITYNVVVASYTLSEIPKTSLRQMAVRSLWGKTKDFLEGGHISDESDTLENQEYQYLDPMAEEMDRGYVFAPKNTRLKKFGFHTERFSYIVLRKGERNATDKPWPRVLQPVRLRSRHVICKLCCSSGDLKQKIFTKKKDGDIYKCARHLTKWGDLLPDPEGRQRPVKSKLKQVKEVGQL